ncbi:MAG: N-acetyltransferase family protein [Acidobacteriota bacterium]
MADDPRIRLAVREDAAALAQIYNVYVEETVVSFELEAVPVAEMAARIEAVRAADLPWLVATRPGDKACDEMVGYAYATPWASRPAYRRTVEVSAYVRRGDGGRGIGSRLYRALLADLRRRGMHAALGGIALPNAASVALHEALGFEKVAHLREVGFKHGHWVDVGYWQLIF